MKRFKIMIHGRNFRLNMDGKWDVFGFYTPRYVNASEIILAEQTALADFRRSDKYLKLIAETLNTKDDPPTLQGEDIEECDLNEDFEKGPPGLGFYPESEEEDAEPAPPEGRGEAPRP